MGNGINKFIKANLLFVISLIVLILSLGWIIISPGFEPIISILVSIISCVGYWPKDWYLIEKQSVTELQRSYYSENQQTETGLSNDNVVIDAKRVCRFNWERLSHGKKDKSIIFYLSNLESYESWSKVPIRVVMSSLSNSIGDNQHFLHAYIPDKPPICFYQFDCICAEMAVEDIDNDGFFELIVGYKCGAHSEGIRVFKLDRNLSFYFVEGSDIGSDLPLITWGKTSSNVFFIKTYSRNWGQNREKWNSRYEMFLFENSKFELKKTSKLKWEES